VLLEQHCTEFLQARWRVVERADDRLAFGDGERQHLHLSAMGVLEQGAEGVVVDEVGELEDGFVSERDAGEVHRYPPTL
jgi:hypothetical protein